MTNHDRSCLPLSLNLCPSLSSASMHVTSCCNDFMKMRSSKKFALPNIFANLLPCPLLKSTHNSQSRCLHRQFVFFMGENVVGLNFFVGTVFLKFSGQTFLTFYCRKVSQLCGQTAGNRRMFYLFSATLRRQS